MDNPTSSKPLTIAIPTYNRQAQLLDTLRQLSSQSAIGSCQVVVIDNASPVPVSDYLKQNAPDVLEWVTIHRNAGNLGLSGNLIRCMETADSEWLWILADDDDLTPDAVGMVLDSCRSEPLVDYHLFAHDQGQVGGFAVSSCVDFVDRLDDWGRLGFISTGIYKVARIKEILSVGVNYAYSLFPFVAMILHGLQERNWTVRFDDRILVVPAHKGDFNWSMIFGINGHVVSELLTDDRAARRLLALTSKWSLGPVGLTHDFATRRLQNASGLSRVSYQHKLALIGMVSTRKKALCLICNLLSRLPPAMVIRMIGFSRTCAGVRASSRKEAANVFEQV